MHWGEAYPQLSTLNEWLVFFEEEVLGEEDLITVRKASQVDASSPSKRGHGFLAEGWWVVWLASLGKT